MNPFAEKSGALGMSKKVRHLAPVFPKEWMQPINGQMLPPVWTGGGRGGGISVCAATPAPERDRHG